MELSKEQLIAIKNKENLELKNEQVVEIYKLITSVVQKFYFPKDEIADIIQTIVTNILTNNIYSYNPKKSKFSTFIYHNTYMYCCKFYNCFKSKQSPISLDDFTETNKKVTHLNLIPNDYNMEKQLTSDYIKVLNQLCKKKYPLIYQKYFEKLSILELTKKYDISKTYLYIKLKKELSELKKDLKSKGYETFDDTQTF